jgi:Holliday junction resolvase
MKPKSIIEKGKRGEKEVARRIERMGLGQARRESGSGNGLKKGDIFANIPFLMEVKNEKTTNFLPNIDQAKEQARIGHKDQNKWCLVTIDPRGVQDPERMTIYATVELDELLELLKRNQEPKVKEPDKLLKYQLGQLAEILRRLENDPLNKYEYGRAKKLSKVIIKTIG